MEQVGVFVKDLILSLASLLKEESTPGIVSLFLFLFLFVSCAVAISMMVRDVSPASRFSAASRNSLDQL